MKAPRKKLVIIIAISFVACWGLIVGLRVLFSHTDYDRVLSGDRPLFALPWVTYSDGGTVEYQGLGYRLTRQCRFHVENGEPTGYDYGPILEYQLNWLLLPMTNRKDIRHMPDRSDTRIEPDAAR